MLITEKIAHIVPQAELILLFGSCALRIFRNPPRYASLDTQYDCYKPRNTLHEIRNTIFYLARYDRHYKITKDQLEQLSPCVEKLHEVTERICKKKIESFV